MRIVSLLPAATEICYALGLGDDVVGVSPECDHPPAARTKRIVSRSLLQHDGKSSGETSRMVGERLKSAGALYQVDAQALRSTKPDLILTQGLCEVCAPTLGDVEDIARNLPRPPEILSLDPHHLVDILENIERIGRACGIEARAETVAYGLQLRIVLYALKAESAARWPRMAGCVMHSPDYSSTGGCGTVGRMMAKLYTRTGDTGETGLLGPERVAKDDPRVEAMGAVDELNAVLGLTISALKEKQVRDALLKIQDDLFTVGAELAMARAGEGKKVPRIVPEHVARLEAGIDTFDVGRITEFILPRGSEGLVRLHWARTVARRAERRIVSLSRREPLNPDLLRYMNRLSSLLYQMAVWCQKKERAKTEHPSYRK